MAAWVSCPRRSSVAAARRRSTLTAMLTRQVLPDFGEDH
jgi:hypothetical protein